MNVPALETFVSRVKVSFRTPSGSTNFSAREGWFMVPRRFARARPRQRQRFVLGVVRLEHQENGQPAQTVAAAEESRGFRGSAFFFAVFVCRKIEQGRDALLQRRQRGVVRAAADLVLVQALQAHQFGLGELCRFRKTRDGVVPPPVEHRALERLRVARRAGHARALL